MAESPFPISVCIGVGILRGSDSWVQDSYWLLVISYWLLVISYWLLVIGYWLLVIGLNLNEWRLVQIPVLKNVIKIHLAPSLFSSHFA
jgi:hypothetical protein